MGLRSHKSAHMRARNDLEKAKRIGAFFIMTMDSQPPHVLRFTDAGNFEMMLAYYMKQGKKQRKQVLDAVAMYKSLAPESEVESVTIKELDSPDIKAPIADRRPWWKRIFKSK